MPYTVRILNCNQTAPTAAQGIPTATLCVKRRANPRRSYITIWRISQFVNAVFLVSVARWDGIKAKCITIRHGSYSVEFGYFPQAKTILVWRLGGGGGG